MTVHVNNLKQSFMLLGVTRYLAVEVGNKFDGPFGCVIDGQEAVDQFSEVLETFEVFPLHRWSSKKIGVDVAEL